MSTNFKDFPLTGCFSNAILTPDLETLTARIQPVPPFNFELTARRACWYAEGIGVEKFEDGVWKRVTSANSRPALLTVSSSGGVEDPMLEIRAEGEELEEASMQSLVSEVKWRLCTDYDLTGFYEMAEQDAGLGKAARQFRGLKPGQDVDLFEALVGTILGQQLSTAVALTMQRRLIEKYGRRPSSTTKNSGFPRLPSVSWKPVSKSSRHASSPPGSLSTSTGCPRPYRQANWTSTPSTI